MTCEHIPVPVFSETGEHLGWLCEVCLKVVEAPYPKVLLPELQTVG